MTNSQYLKWFHQIEKSLWKLFAQFDDLCGRCAKQTLHESKTSKRNARDEWCCCMIDNQVHDNWPVLNANQNRSDRNWYKKLVPLEIGRMPGNGPCPALGPNGCQLKKHRPITCTTQLCTKMLKALNRLNLIKCPVSRALQIEDIIKLPDILPSLYGTNRKTEKVSKEDVEEYLSTINSLRSRFSNIPIKQRQDAINSVQPSEF